MLLLLFHHSLSFLLLCAIFFGDVTVIDADAVHGAGSDDGILRARRGARGIRRRRTRASLRRQDDVGHHATTLRLLLLTLLRPSHE